MLSLRELFKRLPSDGALRGALRRFNIGMMRPGKIQSVRDLAISLGLDVRQVNLPRRMAGRLVSDPFADSGYAIEVNRDHSIQSRRYTVLHEIGHFLLHIDRKDPLFDGLHLNRGNDEFYYDVEKENEANAVADVLLFGDGALEGAFTLHGGDEEKIARFFGVSEPMVRVGLKRFGIGSNNK